MRPQVSRRDLLKMTAAGLVGVSSAGWIEQLARAAADAPAAGSRKSCILLWMNGGPSQGHTFDVKPNGEFGTIPTTVEGIRISEHLPQLAGQMRHLALLRSMSTSEAVHERARFLMHTGYRQSGASVYPSLGCIASHELGQPDFELPNFVAIDGGIDGNNAGGAYRSTPAFLGPRHAPLVVADPDRGVENLRPAIELNALDARASFLDRQESRFQERLGAANIAAHRTTYQRAMQLLHSSRSRAFDLDREPEQVRQLYGNSQFGKGCLLARRLVETGVPFVEVTYGGWDDHGGAAAPIRRRSPIMDRAMAGLIQDLSQRGLLDNTLVVWMGEFGRSPGNGDNHYARCWTTVLAGGGIRAGQVVGRSSDRGDTPAERPISPTDYMATLCRILGLDHDKQFTTRENRPVRLVDRGGSVVEQLFQ